MIEPHERAPTGMDWSRPIADLSNQENQLPGWDEIPDGFKNDHGLPKIDLNAWEANPDIDADLAASNMLFIATSWRYSVEHKTAALMWLLSIWYTKKASF